MLLFLNDSLDLVMDSLRLLSDLFTLSTGRLPLHPTINNRPLIKARAKKNANFLYKIKCLSSIMKINARNFIYLPEMINKAKAHTGKKP